MHISCYSTSLTLPSPWQPPVCFLSRVCCFWVFHIHGIAQHGVCDWLLCLSAVFFVHLCCSVLVFCPFPKWRSVLLMDRAWLPSSGW